MGSQGEITGESKPATTSASGLANPPPSGSSALSKRVLTAIVGGSVFLAFVTLGGVGGCLIVSAFLIYKMAREFSVLLFRGSLAKEKQNVFVGLALASSLLGSFKHSSAEVGAATFVVLCTYYLIRAKRSNGTGFQTHLNEMMLAGFALTYIGLVRFLPVLRSLPKGVDWTLLFVGTVWITDSAAYFGGQLLGSRKLYPAISPNKTLEGAISGAAVSVVFAVAYKLFSQPEVGWFKLVVFAAIVSVSVQVGDLVESFIKRGFDVKDLGQSLPGHGGYLDRFDGFIFALPIGVLLVRYLG